jgi:hypothetical protein
MRPQTLFLLLVALSTNINAVTQTGAVTVQAPQPSSQIQAELGKLTPALADQARALLAETDERKRAQLTTALIRRDSNGVLDFVLAVLAVEPSPAVRLAIVDSLGRNTNPKMREALSKLAASDADVRVSLLALERLRVQLIQEGRDLLNKRLENARSARDDAAVTRLAAEQERWISLARGTMLPSFLRTPPARFSVKPDGQPVRVLAFGDFGTGSPAQKQTAATMSELHKKAPFDFGITLGDNYYPAGMASPTDPRWKQLWDELYDPLKIKFYAALGNHDWVMSDSPAAEILYSANSPSWRMPSPYYTFTAGPVQFFALDTNEVSEAQLIWLDGELAKSTSKWKIVYGHHPIYSDGEHGDSLVLTRRLLPLLKNRVDVYLVGHDHILNHIKAEAGVEFFVSGGGGAGLYKVKPAARSLFAESKNGFSILEFTPTELKITFIGIDSKPLYEYSMRK